MESETPVKSVKITVNIFAVCALQSNMLAIFTLYVIEILTGSLVQVSIHVYGGLIGGFGTGCGASSGVRIYIEQKNRDYCFVELPSFWHGVTVTLTRSRQELGSCTDSDFEAGGEKINVWIHSTEKVCVNYINLLFSTQNRQVTFLRDFRPYTMPVVMFGYGTNAHDAGVYTIINQSRELKIQEQK